MSAIVINTQICGDAFALLRRSFGVCPAKVIARYADVSVRTAENWVQGRCLPRMDHVMRLMRHPVFYAEFNSWAETAIAEENAIRERLNVLQAPRKNDPVRALESGLDVRSAAVDNAPRARRANLRRAA